MPAPTKEAGQAPDDVERRDELFLIDGNSLAYRAFFALPESIATADGRPTNAIYGFASMMVKILIDHQPEGRDRRLGRGEVGPREEYEPYKAQRKPRPDLLKEQWPHLAPLAEAFGFTNVHVEGYEADDVIATLASSARETGIPVMVVSGDRDVYQVVGDGVRVMTTSRGVTDTRIYDPEGVVERYGVPPELVPDLIGLKGDTSDNIPGVPGIGDKTAAQLLQRVRLARGGARLRSTRSRARSARRTSPSTPTTRGSRSSSRRCSTTSRAGRTSTESCRASPDRSRLRDVAAEFELRAVIQRLEDELDEAVPGRAVDETIEVEAVEGTLADLADGRGRRRDQRRALGATDGAKVVDRRGADLGALALEDLGERPLIAHDARALGGGGGRALAAAAARGSSTSPTTRWSPPT